MSEIGSVHFYYKTMTFYLQNIERADATPGVNPWHDSCLLDSSEKCHLRSWWGGVCQSHPC